MKTNMQQAQSAEQKFLLTIFSTPKPFVGRTRTIQYNALRSWRHLGGEVQILIFGSDSGTAQAAESIGATHIPEVALSEWGTGLVSDMFNKAKSLSDTPLLCYMNADMIVMGDFLTAVLTAHKRFRRFLLVGQRWDVDVDEDMSFEDGWQDALRERVSSYGRILPFGIDYFVYPKHLWEDIPPLAVGRGHWDHWPLYDARKRNAAVIDATPMVTAVHQNHDYSHHAGGKAGVYWDSKDAQANFTLLGGSTNMYTVREATHVMTPTGIKTRCRSCWPVCSCCLD